MDLFTGIKRSWWDHLMDIDVRQPIIYSIRGPIQLKGLQSCLQSSWNSELMLHELMHQHLWRSISTYLNSGNWKRKNLIALLIKTSLPLRTRGILLHTSTFKWGIWLCFSSKNSKIVWYQIRMFSFLSKTDLTFLL